MPAARIESEALVARVVAYGEADAVVTLLTESNGKVAVMVRGARKSQKRFGGALEPFHTINAAFDERRGDLGVLRDARITKMRHGIVSRLDALDAAGTALRWARHLFPARTREPEGWRVLIALLDALDSETRPVRAALAEAGLGLLAACGYALDFERCVQCGKPCPEGRLAYIDAARGGIVCRSCGGGGKTIGAELRTTAVALSRGEAVSLGEADARELLALIDDAMAAHAEYDPTRSGKG
jgi:DNA repair protein RecO (recombination protein O)